MDFLEVGGLGADGLGEVLATAERVKRERVEVSGQRRGLRVGLFFEKPSLRTRVSCEAAVTDLGGVPFVLKQDEVGLGKREAVSDVARVLDRYLDLLAFRVFRHGDLETLADFADAPVVNLLSDREHPCQALADLQTLAEHRPLEGSTLAFVGDGDNNVCTSLMVGGAAMGVSISVASPAGYAPAEVTVAAARAIAAAGIDIVVTEDPAEAVRGADAVYTDVWTSMGQEAEAAERRKRFIPYRVDETLFALADPSAIFLHCLPAHRGDEVTDGVMDHERSRVFDQAENRMHAFKALVLHLTG